MKTVWIKLTVKEDYDDVHDELVVEDFIEVKEGAELHVFPVESILKASGKLAAAVQVLFESQMLGMPASIKKAKDALDEYNNLIMDIVRNKVGYK